MVEIDSLANPPAKITNVAAHAALNTFRTHPEMRTVETPHGRQLELRPIGPTMTISQASLAFGEPLVRVSLNWKALEDMNVTISPCILSQKEELGTLIHPWYFDVNGNDTGWDFPNAHMVSVLELANDPALVSRQHEENIRKVAALFKQMEPPIQVTALAYTLPNGQRLLLDSNHRIAALATIDVPFRLIIMSINGPLNGNILPDLMHFESDKTSLHEAVATAEKQRADEQKIGSRA